MIPRLLAFVDCHVISLVFVFAVYLSSVLQLPLIIDNNRQLVQANDPNLTLSRRPLDAEENEAYLV